MQVGKIVQRNFIVSRVLHPRRATNGKGKMKKASVQSEISRHFYSYVFFAKSILLFVFQFYTIYKFTSFSHFQNLLIGKNSLCIVVD